MELIIPGVLLITNCCYTSIIPGRIIEKVLATHWLVIRGRRGQSVSPAVDCESHGDLVKLFPVLIGPTELDGERRAELTHKI